jgi:hypothetical protein
MFLERDRILQLLLEPDGKTGGRRRSSTGSNSPITEAALDHYIGDDPKEREYWNRLQEREFKKPRTTEGKKSKSGYDGPGGHHTSSKKR